MKFPLRRRGWIHAAGPRRIALEAGIVTFALTLPLALLFVGDPEFRAVLDLGTMEGGVTGGVLGAARRRRGGEARRLRREVTGAVVLAVGVWVGVSLANLAGVARMPWTASADWEASTLLVEAPVFGALAAVPAVATYGIGRAALWAWPTWNRARRTRLLWALTHAQLVVSLTLAVVIGTLLATATAAALIGTAIADPRPDYLPPAAAMADAGPLAVALTWLTIGFLPAVIGPFVLSLVVGFVLIPPVALISARVLRRTTARLEDLADATAALRTGDLTARVPVGGEDEVARLQTDFNAMAAHLERSLADLGAERDAVARLLADRRELVAAVSHELRTPVATLRGYLDSALGRWDGAPPPTLRADLGVMATETERLARLIDDLFALSRAEVGRLSIAPRPTDVGALLRRTAEAAAPLAWTRGKVQVLAEAPAALPPALVDPDRLEQVVGNLLANAVRHTPPGGLVVLGAVVEGDALVVQVKDTGDGIAAADLPHVWDRFYRSDSDRDRDGGGAGLGLALVKELTEAMGGSVGVESAAGAGSCFSLRLPIA